MIIVDSSGLLALLDRGESAHRAVNKALAGEHGPLLVTDFVLAEVDYLILKRLGAQAEQAFVDQILEGVLTREPVSHADLERAREIGRKLREHEIGLTDATLMAVAERLRVRRVLTLDRRHFALYRDAKGRNFELVPD